MHFYKSAPILSINILFTHPIYIPAPPIPAIMRPQIIAFIFGAAPQIALPISKMVMLPMMRYLMSKSPFMQPTSRMIETDPIGKPIPTQGNFSISPKDTKIGPCTSAAMVVSRPGRC